MIGESQVGPLVLADGAKAPIRAGKDGALVVQDAHGKYQEAALRGKLFSAITAVTGVAPGTAIGTTAAFALVNPIGSNVNLVVQSGRMGYVSGTLGAGVVEWLGGAYSTTAVTGTAITPQAAIVGNAAGQGKAFTTATLPANPVAIRTFCSLTASLASTAVAPWTVQDVVDGAIVVPPGCSVSLHATAAAGTSPLVVFDVSWEEVAI